MKLKSDKNSYIQLCLHIDERTIYLMVPTYFDDTKKEWMGLVRVNKAKKLITAVGRNGIELQKNFNDNLREFLEGEFAEKTFNLFKPFSYWEEMVEKQ